MITLNQRSMERLKGVHPKLVAVTVRAAELSDLEFIVTCGLRSVEEQRKMVARGVSKTMNSKHLTGHAVDLAPIVDKEAKWDWPYFRILNKFMQMAANELKITVDWGGNFIGSFKDGPHFQIDPKRYPHERSLEDQPNP